MIGPLLLQLWGYAVHLWGQLRADAQHLVARLRADTPRYWQVVQLRAGIVAGALEAYVASGHCPPDWLPYVQHVASACAAVLLMAQLTRHDPPAPSPIVCPEA